MPQGAVLQSVRQNTPAYDPAYGIISVVHALRAQQLDSAVNGMSVGSIATG